jgi:hypothetical protein
MGCEFVQSFFTGAPMKPEAAFKMLKEQYAATTAQA